MAMTVETAQLNNQSILQNFALVEELDAQFAEIISGGCGCYPQRPEKGYGCYPQRPEKGYGCHPQRPDKGNGCNDHHGNNYSIIH
ncbi:hypothetical protein [Nostoc sp. CALU 1950]|uniref:hypothetical protein n=1 Tax=Nostoc sp. CALU 1950 TaxID=3104321 RepID=UPI003EBC5EDA